MFSQEGKHVVLSNAIGGALILTGLYLAQDILVPVAIAILLSFLLTPLVKILMRWYFPNAAAVMTVVLVSFSVLGMVAWLVSTQFVSLIDNLPLYHDNIRSKISLILEPRDSVFTRAAETVDLLQKEITVAAAEAERPLSEVDSDPAPVPVEIRRVTLTPLQTLQQYAQPLLGPIGTAALTLIFVIFILLQRNDLRERFISLVSGGNLNLATQAVDDAGRRISRYLLMHTVINILYGIPVAIGLYFIGVPNALLWGMLSTLLRFIPFIGAWISAIFPLSLAFAIDPGWSMVFMTIGLIVVLELTSNNIIEPWLYGTSTGISAVALIFAALLWTWIWGPVGLFLSTPLTVCVLVIGKNVPALGFLNVLLGSDPVLTPQAQLYHRMLAVDADSMIELIERHLETTSLLETYDQLLLPALVFAEMDRTTGVLAEHRQKFIIESVQDIIDTLELRLLPESGDTSTSCVICIPARNPVDDLTASMFSQILRQADIRCVKALPGTVVSDLEVLIQENEANMICICAVLPSARTSIRRMCRHLKSHLGFEQLIAGMWGASKGATDVKLKLGDDAPEHVATTFTDALLQIKNAIISNSRPISPAIPDDESERIAEVHALGLLDTAPEDVYDTVTQKLAAIFNLPISLVSIVDTDRQFWKSQVGLPEDLALARQSSRMDSLCAHVVAQNSIMVIEDLKQDKRFANNPFVTERGIRFYAGVPLCTPNGHAVGTLCVIDIVPRKITAEQEWLLTLLAKYLMEHAHKLQEIPSTNEGLTV